MRTLIRSTVRCAALAGLAVALAGCSKQEPQSEGVVTHPYPLDRCLVSDDKLGGDPKMETYTFVHGGQEIKLCCKGCLKEFNKNPEMYLAKLPPALPPHAQKP